MPTGTCNASPLGGLLRALVAGVPFSLALMLSVSVKARSVVVATTSISGFQNGSPRLTVGDLSQEVILQLGHVKCEKKSSLTTTDMQGQEPWLDSACSTRQARAPVRDLVKDPERFKKPTHMSSRCLSLELGKQLGAQLRRLGPIYSGTK